MPHDDHIAMLQATVDNLVDEAINLKLRVVTLEAKTNFFESYIDGSINPPSIREGDIPTELAH